MKQLSFDLGPQEIYQPPIVKTPDDVYRADLRLTWHPQSGRIVGAIEVTHEHSRELLAWKLLPQETGMAVTEYLDHLVSDLRWRLEEIDAPF